MLAIFQKGNKVINKAFVALATTKKLTNQNIKKLNVETIARLIRMCLLTL